MSTGALNTDLYELTMMQGYFLHNHMPRVVFDMFYQKQPFNSGYIIFAGLETLLTILKDLKFENKDLEYLDSLKMFKKDFLDYLKDFRFRGDIYAMDEGSIAFPGEPLLRVHCSLAEAQFIESILLNIINFQSLIATKSSRIYLASLCGKILEFGLRRAQGLDGALSASRAAYIGGAYATSNTRAGQVYGIPVKGTMAHSWIMAFDSELESFEKYAEIYPVNPIFLIDTYDSLGSGIENAIKVGKKLSNEGKNFGVRLDSGDLHYLSVRIREKLDSAGLKKAFITVSNDLNEEIIHQLITDKAPIDFWGVGTQMVTGGCDSSLSGVYKLSAKEINGVLRPAIKLSNNPEKTTNPGVKQIYRFLDQQGSPLGDLIALDNERIEPVRSYKFNHPMYEYKYFILNHYHSIRPLLTKKMSKGEICSDLPSLDTIRTSAIEGLNKLDYTFRRIINPHIYKVSLSEKLKNLKYRMIHEYSGSGS